MEPGAEKMTPSWESDGIDQADHGEQASEAGIGNVDVPSFTRSSRRRPAILLVTVFAGGLAAIIIMRSLTGGVGQVMADTGIEEAVSGFLDFMRDGKMREEETSRAGGDPFADLVTDHYVAMQVPPEALRSNPFITPWTQRTAVPGTHTNSPMTDSQKREIRRSELAGCDVMIDVQSIMTGSNPIATINDTVVRIGDDLYLESMDTVCILREVNTDSVLMEAIDEKLGLSVTFTVPLRSE